MLPVPDRIRVLTEWRFLWIIAEEGLNQNNII